MSSLLLIVFFLSTFKVGGGAHFPAVLQHKMTAAMEYGRTQEEEVGRTLIRAQSGDGSQGTGSQETDSQGTGSQGTGSQGMGSQGTGSQGTDRQGTNSQGSADTWTRTKGPTHTARQAAN